jgi:hypothetical protein
MEDYEAWYDVIAATGEVFSDLNFRFIQMLSQMVPVRKIIKTENYKVGGFSIVKTSFYSNFEELIKSNSEVN